MTLHRIFQRIIERYAEEYTVKAEYVWGKESAKSDGRLEALQEVMMIIMEEMDNDG